MAESLLSTTLPSNTIRPEWPRHEISTVFVENSNTKATMEDVYYNNNIILSGQSTAFNSTQSFKLTKAYHFIRNAVLKIAIKFDGTDPQFYNDYVGHSFINNIKYQIDSTELLQQNGWALVDIMNESCEDQFQKDKLLEMSGYRELGRSLANNDVAYLYVPLINPFCGIDAGSFHSAKAFPLYLVPGHIELLVQLNSEAVIGAQVSGHVSIQGISLLVNYGKIGNFSQMSKMIRYPTRQYINTQRFVIANAANDGATKQTLSLTSFRRAELTNILLRWCPNYANATALNFYDGAEISQLNVLFNGVQIWSNIGGPMSDPIWDVLSGEKPSYMGRKRQYLSLTATNAAQTTGNVVQAGVQYYYNNAGPDFAVKQESITGNGSSGTNLIYLEFFGYNGSQYGSQTAITSNQYVREQRYYNINLSEIRANMMNNNEYALGYDLSKQTLNLEMVLPKVFTAGAYGSFGGYIYVTYVYNSIYQLEEDQSSVLAF